MRILVIVRLFAVADQDDLSRRFDRRCQSGEAPEERKEDREGVGDSFHVDNLVRPRANTSAVEQYGYVL